MAVSPFKTFSAGEVLTASDLNASFSQVFDNGEDLAYPATQARDYNGFELILDADGDSSITADTDDQIDFKLGGTDYFIFKAGATTNVLDINGSVTTTGAIVDISDADALTTGKILNLISNSADASTRELVTIHNDNASSTNATCLELIQDANAPSLFIDHNGGDDSAILIAASQTVGDVVNITADALTTGDIMSLVSNSADTSARNLINLVNDNAAATGTIPLSIQQDSSASSISVVANGNARILRGQTSATTSNGVELICDSITTGSVLFSTADALTTGKILNLISDSADASTRELVTIHNDNTAATGTSCLELIQDASFRALYIDANGTAAAVDMDCAGLGIDIDTTSASSGIIDMTAGSGSYAGNEVSINCARSASLSYSFLVAVSASETTPDTEFDFRGDGNGFADGSFTGGGADLADFYEWADGNPNGEDRRGVSVVLEGKYIREATAEDPPHKIIGAISANPSIVGDSAWNRWHGKYLRDDFGSYVMEDYEVWSWVEYKESGEFVESHSYAFDNIPDDVIIPDDKEVTYHQRRKLNPDFDPGVSYTPRAERKEWDWVGRVGKLRIRKGQITHPDWVWMQEISDTVDEWTI